MKVLAAVKVTSEGRIALTRAVMDALELTEGDFVKLGRTEDDRVCIEKA